MFDISDDIAGDVHEVAQQSLIVFANETESNEEVPTLVMQHDPTGAIHYMLGHKNSEDGPFQLAAGEEIELKVSGFRT